MNIAAVTLFHKCNFHCPYCYLGDKRHDDNMGPLATTDGVEKFVAFFADRGEWEFNFTGGEPTINPRFFTLVGRLSARHKISFLTNLSCELEPIFEHLPPARVTSIQCSLQPESEADFPRYRRKIEQLKRGGYRVSVTFVGAPERLGKIPAYAEQFHALEVPFVVQGLLGAYLGGNYPDSYTPAERAVLRDHAGHYFTFYNLELRQTIKSAGKRCSAGYRRIIVNGLSGDIHPCQSWRRRLGNVYSGEAALLTAPTRCLMPVCACDLHDELREALRPVLGKRDLGRPIPIENWENFKRLMGFDRETRAFLADRLGVFLHRLFPLDSRILLYGAGSHTANLLKLLREFTLGSNLVAILDGDPRKAGTTLGGLPVVSPSTLGDWRPDRIVISSRRFEAEIYDELLAAHRERSWTIHRLYDGNPLGELLAHLLIRGETLADYCGDLRPETVPLPAAANDRG